VATKKTPKGNNPATTLHVYTRVSTVAQADKGTSLESQLQIGVKQRATLSRLGVETASNSFHPGM